MKGRILKHSIPEPNTGCWLWQMAMNKGGYGWVLYQGDARLAHRVSWMAFHGEIPAGLYVLHRCDTPACVNPEHLFLGTHRDNMDDKVRKGRQAKPVRPFCGGYIGEKNGRAKLTEEKVREIRSLKGALSQKTIAQKYGVGQTIISQILARVSWAHVP